ncbi:MAG: sugar transferase [Clostridia bacterium]|nr:sugar transferase [Clostridia bacterium]
MEKSIIHEPEIRTDIPTPKDTIYSRYIKRGLDIFLSGMAILVLSPILLVIVIFELIYHGRPVFYIDKRPGKDGKIFNMYKFRSMTNERDENGKLLHPSKRITTFGRILRRTSLDELAGLFNVFNGTMSVIGPRPLMMDYLPLYNERHKYRHSVRPGLACWNLNTKNLTSASWTWNTQFESDIYYIENVSLWLDIKMVLKTIKIIFTKNEMRANSNRIKFNGHNLNDTRTRQQLMEEEQKLLNSQAH